ncbi:MAG: NAD(+)/NADH kinase [Gemmatimonadetes bacterium]|nr:NAD(+)/NADH kinase [Gemmatimonadota bacterium]
MNVGVVGNPRYQDLAAILSGMAARAPGLGLRFYTEPELAPFWPQPVPPLGIAQLDALVTLGGDGTLLRGARLLGANPVPVLGINLGRVGFLTSCTRDELDLALDRLTRRDYVLEPRQGLEAEIRGVGGSSFALPPALNDVTVHKAGVARMIQLNVQVDDQEIGPYSADGLIVATPTGSTAYSLSAGGPIIAPDVEAIVITPICAHTLAVRPLVVPASSSIAISPIQSSAEDLLVSVDGQQAMTVGPNDRLMLGVGAHRVPLVRFGPKSYFARMRESLRWGDLAERETR